MAEHCLHVELKGLQRFIFQSQRLSAMLGGNQQVADFLDHAVGIAERAGWGKREAAGGHLEIFRQAEDDDPGPAKRVWDEIRQLLDTTLPGVRAHARLRCGDETARTIGNHEPTPPLTLPILEPCGEFDGLPANSEGPPPDHKPQSTALKRRRRLHDSTHGQEFAGFSKTAGGYIALIKMDGNSIGDHVDKANPTAFFEVLRSYRDQVLQRLAAKPLTFKGLMNAGDDLLLLTTPRTAFEWVHAFATEWQSATCADRRFAAISFAAGIVIASHKLPIHRLHDLAETLCASAKRKSRRQFAVDWMLCTQSWLDELESQRQRDFLVPQGDAGSLILSARPLLVLPSDGSNDESVITLAGLLRRCQNLEQTDHMPSRGQLRTLAQALRRGEFQSELLHRKLLARCANWKDAMPQLWLPADGPDRLSPLLDLLEIYESDRLGRDDPADGQSTSARPEHAA